MSGAAPPAAQRAAWREAGLHGDETIGTLLATPGVAGCITFSGEEGEHTIERDALVALAARCAGGLRELGVAPGSVVAAQLPSGVDAWAMAGGAWLLGATVCPIVDIYGPNEVGFILHESGADVLAVPTRWRGRSGVDVARAAGFDGTLLTLGDGAPSDAVPLERLREQAPVRAPAVVGADDVALLVYTSGTTAAPKGVQHSHNTLLAGLRPVGPLAVPTSLGTFPAGHIAGTLAALRALVRGGDVVVMDRWSATRAAALVERHSIAFAAGTPFYLQGLLDAAQRDGRDLSSLTTFLTGAAPVPPALLERARERGILGWRTYGSTEHPGLSSGSPLDDEATRHRTDGRLSPFVDIRFVDEDHHDVPAGEEGEIVVRGPKQFVGYRDASLDAEAFLPGGWFLTGDVGRLDGDGRLTITDRRKDVIIRGGENISSKEVEDVLATIAGVVEVAVCAQPDPALGEVVAAFVRLAPSCALSLEEVGEHFRAAAVPHQKTPAALYVVEDFPRTAAGKIVKAELRSSLT